MTAVILSIIWIAFVVILSVIGFRIGWKIYERRHRNDK
jgi:hypothetical protein